MSTLAHDGEDADIFELGLSALREEQGTLEQARALEERLLGALGAEALSAPITPPREPCGAWHTKPVSLLLGTALLIGLGTYLGNIDDSPRREVRPRTVAPSGPAVAPALEPPAVPAATQHPEVAPAPQPTKAATPRTLQPRRKRVAEAARPDELTLLQNARAALRDDPQAALRFAEQHAREYPQGVFVQEREMLAINALLKQRKSAAAHERAARFVAAHEGSSYAVQLRALLATKASAGHTADPREGSER